VVQQTERSGRRACGIHEVVIDTPEHLGHPLSVPQSDMSLAVQAFRDRWNTFRERAGIRLGLAFKNYGPNAGASLFHSHSQVMGLTRIPRLLRGRFRQSKQFSRRYRRCLMCTVLDHVLNDGTRVVWESTEFVAFCPYAPRLPYETWIVPRQHASHFELDDRATSGQIWSSVAGILARLEKSMQELTFNLVVQSAPFDRPVGDHYHWYIELLPRYTRQAGFEWGSGCFINPVLPERAAELMRKL
jgi:UDPglucose--hexose-1-phosphate uridylyltransferase